MRVAPNSWWLEDPATDSMAGIDMERAGRELLAGHPPRRSVVVAILDGGVDTAHVAIHASLWTNPGEVPGNEKDDDGDGYVDDVHGWDFIGGPDGKDVNHDTFEVTRQYVLYARRFADADRDTLSAAARADYDRYLSIKADFEKRRAKAQATLKQILRIDTVVTKVNTMLRDSLSVDSLTVERVAAARPQSPLLIRAKQIYLQLAQEGITPSVLADGERDFRNQVDYGYNTDYDPRAIVGDNYADPNQHDYGNADIVGPDAMHGTHVSGIVLAEAKAAAAGGPAPDIRIMVIRVVPDGDERDKDVANGIRYAVDHGANIINMSFGKPYSPFKEVVDQAVRYANRHGVLLVHAAGNDSEDRDSVTDFPTPVYQDGDTAADWIEVGASSWRGPDSLAATFTDYGQHSVDVFAPGVDIRSSVPGDKYAKESGTSMAAPVVSGLAAVLMAYFPSLKTADVKRIILDSTTQFPGQQVPRPGDGDPVLFSSLSRTGGVVNAFRAIREAEAGRPSS